MSTGDNREDPKTPRGKSHMPENSFFFEKAVPILLVVLGLVMAGLIVFAGGVLLGFIQF
jgi:hypothetical protein